MNGQPYVRGMRPTVRRVVEALAADPNREELKSDDPDIDDEDIGTPRPSVTPSKVSPSLPIGLPSALMW
ncbi:hypothetical protein CKO25_07610 [Thiocapsa imhoffii]|uniref:Uncharacterized protein n=1 Tax=Thiocapsa imhoffii TaxID=382777 RepID=A0A9X1B895_9GAMM|nr:DUF433 domain-containing protein [Thiocapsa imhoffii]MBK1644522.1 hypothetical protein [Thiocapsa imhoffii]